VQEKTCSLKHRPFVERHQSLQCQRSDQRRSRRVEPGRPDGDGGAAGSDGEDAAADAALARQADAEGELARGVVMAAGHHDGVDAPGAHRRRHFGMCQRVDAAMGEEQPEAAKGVYLRWQIPTPAKPSILGRYGDSQRGDSHQGHLER